MLTTISAFHKLEHLLKSRTMSATSPGSGHPGRHPDWLVHRVDGPAEHVQARGRIMDTEHEASREIESMSLGAMGREECVASFSEMPVGIFGSDTYR